jgi:hypothetical protein
MTIKMTHPKSSIDVEVQPSAVATYESQGWRKATDGAPAGNASLEAWQDFAREKGFTDEELEGKSRDDLRAALS